MRNPHRWPLSLVLAYLLTATAAVAEDRIPIPEPTCSGDHGTELQFVDSPAEAAKQALEEEKLVFVLHVSGHFETPEFT